MNELNQVQNLTSLAIEINSIKDQTRKIVISNSIEIGRRLTVAKELCKHGDWRDWLKSSVNYSERTAQQLMKIFDEYTSDQLSFTGESNTQALADLSYTQAVILLGIPKEEREDFIENNDIDEISTRELQELVKENKKLKEDKSKSDKQIVDLEKAIDEDIERLSKSNAFVNELQAKLEIADKNNDAKSKEEVEKIKSDLKKAKLDNKTLTNTLRLEKEKPVQVETIEVVPDEIKQEVEELKAKLGNEDSPLVIKAKLLTKGIYSDFNALQVNLMDIKELDLSTFNKVNDGVLAMISKIQEILLNNKSDGE